MREVVVENITDHSRAQKSKDIKAVLEDVDKGAYDNLYFSFSKPQFLLS